MPRIVDLPFECSSLAEMEFRFNRRKGYDLFAETLRHMVTCDPLSFRDLLR